MNLRALRFKIKDTLRVKNQMLREFLAEFLGMFTLIVST